MNRSSERLRDAAALWDEQRRAPFPAGLRGVAFGDTDLVLLDADIAGCVLTWLNNDGVLDLWRIGILRGCVEDLDRVIPELTPLTGPAGVRYYERLRRLALLTLSAGPPVMSESL
ncbi:hypothetical protein [Streptomyces sp. NPDC058953]|uniref:hypothetical protein n=1 Tax=unclassified Streptomyces TaxID=2593676 RepID=UPI00368D1524